jgi:GNAT superfamily N-acetyltransferase
VDLREILPPDTGTAFLAMRELRTEVGPVEDFVRVVDHVQRAAGYRLVGAFDVNEENAAAVAGFRVGHNLAWGHFLYVDDLSTRPQYRRRGLGRALLVWLGREAASLGCDQLHLDSGVGLSRAEAHRLYLNAGLVISAHHFAMQLSNPG